MTTLNPNGTCCGRRTLRYKRPYPHQFCIQCRREFDLQGGQVPNFTWREKPDGSFEQVQFPTQENYQRNSRLFG